MTKSTTIKTSSKKPWLVEKLMAVAATAVNNTLGVGAGVED
jgi:hypothetical protein